MSDNSRVGCEQFLHKGKAEILETELSSLVLAQGDYLMICSHHWRDLGINQTAVIENIFKRLIVQVGDILREI